MRELIEQCTGEDREAVLTAAWIVARVGQVRARERAVLETARRDLGISEEVGARVAASARRGRRPSSVVVPSGDAARRVMFHYAVQVAAADGIIAAGERRIAEQVGGVLGLGPGEVAAELDRATAVSEPPRRSQRPPRRSERQRTRPEAGAPELVSLLVQMRPANVGGVGMLATLAAIVVGNLVPAAGVLYFDWDVPAILFLYWLENLIVGPFAVWRIWLAPGGRTVSRRSSVSGQMSHVNFFMILYSLFTAFHGFLVLAVCVILGSQSGKDVLEGIAALRLSLLLGALGLLVEHAASFYFDYVQNEAFHRTTADKEFGRPIPRLMALHVSVLAGAFILGSLEGIVLMLVGLHLVIDLIGWAIKLPSRGLPGRLRVAVIGGSLAGAFAFAFSFVPGMFLLGILGMFSSLRWAFYAAATLSCFAATAVAIAALFSAIDEEGFKGPKRRLVWAVTGALVITSCLVWGASTVRKGVLTDFREKQTDHR